MVGSSTAEYCAQHAPDGVVDVISRKCGTENCSTQPSFGVVDSATAEYCAQHAPDGMTDVKNRKCKTVNCGKRSSFGVAGTKRGEYCAQHASDGMVNVRNRKQCRIEGCHKSFTMTRVGNIHDDITRSSCSSPWRAVLCSGSHGFSL